MNMQVSLLTLAVAEVEGEARVLDTALGQALGMAKPRAIRDIIRQHQAALEQFGILPAVPAKTTGDPRGRGRPSLSFWLNEEQALYVTMHCRTDRADAVKVQLVKVFTAWRRGLLVEVQPVQTALPNFTNPAEAARAWAERYEGEQKALTQVAHGPPGCGR